MFKQKSKLQLFFRNIEAGISLKGSEVKSLRDGKGSIADSYAVDNNGEMFLINSHIHIDNNPITITIQRRKKITLKKRN